MSLSCTYIDLEFLEHYQAFAAALPHHASLISHLTATQTQITDTRSALTDVKDSLGNKRADLVQLWGRGQMLEEMMKLLDQMCVFITRDYGLLMFSDS